MKELCQRPTNQNKLYMVVLTSGKLIFKGKASLESKKTKQNKDRHYI